MPDHKWGMGSYADDYNNTRNEGNPAHCKVVAYSEFGVQFKDGTFRESFGAVQGAISDCSTYDAKYYFAETDMLLKEYKRALDGYIEIIERCPEVSHGIAGIASILHRTDNLEESLKWYWQAIQIDPDNYHYITDTADALYSLEYREEAKELLEYSYSINPNHTWTNMLMEKWK